MIIGGGGHAKVVATLLKKHGDWNPIGYTDTTNHGPLLGLPYLGTDDIIPELMRSHRMKNAVLGLGMVDLSKHRAEVIRKIKNFGLILPAIFSPQSIINESTVVGEGSLIMDGAILQPGVHIGCYSIINTGVVLDHDCTIGDQVHIAPGVSLSGGVKLGDNVLVGTGASIVQGLIVSDNVLVGAGAVVASDIQMPGTYVGVPAKLKDL
jgi:sugar O-acyltransferase (sialic acid O-acetyltransferase NeuD family)